MVLKQARPNGDDAKKIVKELQDWVGKEIGPIAKPRDIRFGDNLPKTRSGKIMRRLLRSIAKGEEITQDVSTLENPAILEQLSETAWLTGRRVPATPAGAGTLMTGPGIKGQRLVALFLLGCLLLNYPLLTCSPATVASWAYPCFTPTSSRRGRSSIALMALVVEKRSD